MLREKLFNANSKFEKDLTPIKTSDANAVDTNLNLNFATLIGLLRS